MPTLVSFDGRLLPPARARISVFDRGFLYGDSIYEVLRTYGGRPFELPAHLTRLGRSARLIGLRLPLRAAAFRRRIGAALHAARNRESYVRVIVTRGEGPIGLDPALAVRPHVLVIVRPLHAPPAEIYRRGVSVSVVDVRRNLRQAIDPAAKTGNYLNNVLALREARARGGYEALMLDARGRVAEGSTSNVFAVFGARVVTPPLDGILAGVTRGLVLALAGRLGLEARERPLRPEDLRRADELFLTSTLRELVPIVRVDGRRVGAGTPGPTTLRLLETFRRRASGASR
ncbi:MAG TPA: aminotransferase class IV [Myxococcales bacterium]|nr:aminotransferase class IV [Myxococcales bacterium]